MPNQYYVPPPDFTGAVDRFFYMRDRANALKQQEFDNQRVNRLDAQQQQLFDMKMQDFESRRQAEEAEMRRSEQLQGDLSAFFNPQPLSVSGPLAGGYVNAENALKIPAKQPTQGDFIRRFAGNPELVKQAGNYFPKPDEVGYEIKQDENGRFVYMPKRPGQAVPSEVTGRRPESMGDAIAKALSAQNTVKNIPQYEMDLRKEFNALPEVKQFAEIDAQASRLTEAMAEARGGGSKVAVDQTLITILNKMLDPSSVVRESEYARTSGDLSVLSRLRGKLDKLTSGGAGLDAEERQALYRMATRFQKVAAGKYKRIRGHYEGIAKSRGIPVDNVLMPYEEQTKDYSGMSDTELLEGF